MDEEKIEKDLAKNIEEILMEKAEAQKKFDEVKKKEQRAVSKFCSMYDDANVMSILRLLDAYGGLPPHDKEKLERLKKYPDISLEDILNLIELKDIYSNVLNDGGKADE